LPGHVRVLPRDKAESEVRMVLPHSSEIEQQWSQVRGLLRAEVGDTAYSTWLKPLDLAAMDGDRVVIAVPTQFMRDWVVAHYADRIRALWTSINPNVRSIALNVRPAAAANATAAASLSAAPAILRAVEPEPANETAASGSPPRPSRPSTPCSSTAASASARPT
jgi:chromosomal replication initiator protein